MARRNRPRLAVLALLALGLAGPARAACDRAGFTVVLDVGHSAESPGAISARGVTEYRFNLNLSAVIEAQLVAQGFTRTTRLITNGGRGSLGERAARAGGLGADLLISVHHDSVQPKYLETWTWEGREQRYSDRFRGWSLFVSQAGPRPRESAAFARLLADRLLGAGLPFTTHHAEPIPGENRPLLDPSRGIHRFDGLAVLKNARGPAVLLEAGVIVNREEEVLLAGAERQSQIARAVTGAVEDFCAGR